ncbi:hypothetical protein [Paenibacillus polysaccharolyticus]|uniref:hypothetical protein n=1 Tax=Paenibacillus polysaccharolyticus TaxID=582692 RepID=UPI0011132EB8|nr:hypothetical protein [Paenibacillus polysaccharolyticus]
MLTTNEYFFSIRDIFQTSQGYLLMVGSSGSRPLDYKFVYIPYSRYASILMLDFYLARNEADHVINEELIKSIKNDLEGEEQFIVLSDKSSKESNNMHSVINGDKEDSLHGEISEGMRAMRERLSSEIEEQLHDGHLENTRNGFFENELDRNLAGRKQDLQRGVQHTDHAAWRIDDNKELKIFKNVAVARNLLKNLDKIHPSQWALRLSDQDVMLDYIEDSERNTSVEVIVERILESAREQGKHTQNEVFQVANRTIWMLTDRMVTDGAVKEIERDSFIERTLMSVKERLKDTFLSQLVAYSTYTQRELYQFYEEMLTGNRNHHRDIVRTGIEGFSRLQQKQTSNELKQFDATPNRTVRESWLEIFHKQISASVHHLFEMDLHDLFSSDRTSQFGGHLNAHTKASRQAKFEAQTNDDNQWGWRKSDVSEMVVSQGIQGKLKTRQFPSLIHQSVSSERNAIHDVLLTKSKLYNRAMEHHVSSFRNNGIMDGIRSDQEVPVIINKGYTWGSMDRRVQTDIDRPITDSYHPLSALREFQSDYWFIPTEFPEAGRIISNHSVQINQEFPKSNRIIHHNPVYIEDVTTQLKAHRLIVVLGALEDTDKQMVASREATELGYLFRAKPDAYREDVEVAHVERDKPESTRIDKEAAHLLREYSEGRRIDKFEAMVEEKYYKGNVGPRSLYLPKIEKEAKRIHKSSMEFQSSRLGGRSSETEIWVPQHIRAEREEKPLTIEDTIYEVLKSRNHKQLFLNDELYIGHKGRKELDIARLGTSQKKMTQKSMVYMDEMLKKFISDGGTIGNKLYPGHLEDSLLAAELLDRPAIVLELMIDAVYQNDDYAFLDENLLAGIRDRIEALIEVGILSSGKQSSDGLITFSSEGILELHQGIIHSDMPEASPLIDNAWNNTTFIAADPMVREAKTEDTLSESTKEKDSDYTQIGVLDEQHVGSRLDHRGETIEVTYADWDAKPIVFNKDNALGFVQASAAYFNDNVSDIHASQLQQRGGLETETIEAKSPFREGLNREKEYEIAHTLLRAGSSLNHYDAGSMDYREFDVSEEYSTGLRFMQQAEVSEIYNLGSAVNRELQETGGILSVDSSQSRRAHTIHLYTSSTSGLRQARTSEGYEWGSTLLRQALYDDNQYSQGYRDLHGMEWVAEDVVAETYTRDGEILKESFSALSNLKQAMFTDDSVFGENSKRLGELEFLDYAIQEKYSERLEQIFGIQIKRGHEESSWNLALKEKDSWINEDVQGQVYKLGNLEEQWTANKPQIGQLEVQWTASKYQYGLIDEELNGGDKPRYADVPVESIGGLPLKYGQIEEELQASKPQYGNLEEQLLAIKPQYGTLEEIFTSIKPQYGKFEELLLMYKSERNSGLVFDVSGDKLGRDAYTVEQEYGSKGQRLSHIESEITGKLNLNEAIIESLRFGVKPEVKGEWQETLLSRETLRFSTLNAVTEALSIHRAGEVGQQVEGRKDDSSMLLLDETAGLRKVMDGELDSFTWAGSSNHRDAEAAAELAGGYDARETSLPYHMMISSKEITQAEFDQEESTTSIKLNGMGLTADDFSYAEFEERIALVQQENIQGDRDHEWNSHHEYQTEEASLANARLSEMQNPEDTFATFEERCAQVITGFIFAERPEMRAEYLEQLYAFLPERTAHLMKIYHVAKTEGRSSEIEIDSVLAYRDRITDGYLPMMDTMAQGLVFDYSDNLLDRGMNPEDWEGGFGVPEEYDPHDPFNVYYPYSKEMDALELVQSDEWLSFGGGQWKRDEQIGKFYSESAIPEMNGWYRNNFLGERYKFSVDFKVDGSEKRDEGVGIIFKMKDIHNYWMFMISGGDSANMLDMRTPMQLYQVVGGRQELVGSPMQPFKWEKDKWYTLSVSVLEGKMQIYTDSKLQYDLMDTD